MRLVVPCMQGCLYDNAVEEATYKVMKTEFVNQMVVSMLHNLLGVLPSFAAMLPIHLQVRSLTTLYFFGEHCKQFSLLANR